MLLSFCVSLSHTHSEELLLKKEIFVLAKISFILALFFADACSAVIDALIT